MGENLGKNLKLIPKQLMDIQDNCFENAPTKLNFDENQVKKIITNLTSTQESLNLNTILGVLTGLIIGTLTANSYISHNENYNVFSVGL